MRARRCPLPRDVLLVCAAYAAKSEAKSAQFRRRRRRRRRRGRSSGSGRNESERGLVAAGLTREETPDNQQARVHAAARREDRQNQLSPAVFGRRWSFRQGENNISGSVAVAALFVCSLLLLASRRRIRSCCSATMLLHGVFLFCWKTTGACRRCSRRRIDHQRLQATN